MTTPGAAPDPPTSAAAGPAASPPTGEPAPAGSPGGAARAVWRPPLLWRLLLVAARVAVPLFCRFRVTGDVSPELRRGPLILAGNHIGIFDPIALVAACRALGVAPRILATGGVFQAPIVGPVLRWCGHIRVDRHSTNARNALTHAVDAVRAGSVVAGYPEGRLTLDPGLWPERGKTGLARVALATGAAVVPVAQWGAHEVIAWDGVGRMLATALSALWRRPVVRVHFAEPVDLSGLRRDAQRAADRITEATIAALRPLRADEPGLPRHVDPTRPVSTARSYLSRRRTYSTTA